MKTHEARTLGNNLTNLIEGQETTNAFHLLSPVLAERTPFAMLGLIGAPLGALILETILPFLDKIAEARTEGGWVVIAAALKTHLNRDMESALTHCQRYICAADIWYGADIFGERVPGPALLLDFEQALSLLDSWRSQSNPWVRRAVGVAVHFWAKHTRGDRDKQEQAETLLAFLAPMFNEREINALKGVGWGLKTMGRYYPDLVTDWLIIQLAHQKPRALMIRKATTYLSPQQRKLVKKANSR